MLKLVKIIALTSAAPLAFALASCDGPASPPVNQVGSDNVVIDECTQADNRLCP